MDAFDLFSVLEDILAAPTSAGLQVGMEVGAGRWPFVGGHPDNWMPPHKGVLLAEDDPRAWRGTVLGDDPSPEAIRAHLTWLASERTRYPCALRCPVLWAFNPERALWESSASLVPYQTDLAKWRDARKAALEGAKR